MKRYFLPDVRCLNADCFKMETHFNFFRAVVFWPISSGKSILFWIAMVGNVYYKTTHLLQNFSTSKNHPAEKVFVSKLPTQFCKR